MIFGLEFPDIEELVKWRGILFKGTIFEVNKVVLLMWAGVIIVSLMFWAASRNKSLVPTGIQNVVEAGVDFVHKDIILQTMGPEGMRFAPLLVTLFFFIFVTNLFEVIPLIQFPVSARMALPAFMSLGVWATFMVVGVASQGFGGYMKSVLVPPGVPKMLLILVTPIEFLSTFLVRPFSLAVRLFANMLAGHLLLVTFAVLAAALFTKTFLAVILPLPFIMLILLTGFEILVAGLQAFIFTILTAVYIGGAMHPEH